MIRFSCNLQFSGRSSVSRNRDLYNIKKVEDLSNGSRKNDTISRQRMSSGVAIFK